MAAWHNRYGQKIKSLYRWNGYRPTYKSFQKSLYQIGRLFPSMTRKPLEKTIENQIKKWLESNGYWWMKVHGDMFQKSGVPDILACINGKCVGIEVKRPGGVVSELQKYNIEKIQAAGGVAFVAYSVEDVRVNLDRFHVI